MNIFGKGQSRILTPRRVMVMALAVLALGIIVSWRGMSHPDSGAGYAYAPGRGDTINVAIAYSPMSLYRYGDTIGGFNYEMMRDMASMYGDKFKFFPVTSVSESLDRLEQGDYDILVADIAATASLKERFRFSVPVYTDRLVLVSRDTTATTPLALAGQQVWAVAGSPAAERLANLSREIGDSIHIQDTHTYTAEQLVMLVNAGEIERAVVNQEVAQKLRPECPAINISAQISFSQFQSWIMNKNSTTLADTIDAQIERFRHTPAYTTLTRKYDLND
ncbi:MAG: transporter substrate-binding domain-containing protein [Duncaniella sp.]|nr:transporter substrate-binding domain-containing protein [Duncaniella sp.]